MRRNRWISDEKIRVAHCALRELFIELRKGVFAFLCFKRARGLFVEGENLCTLQYIKEGRRPLRNLVTVNDGVQFLPSNFRGEVLEGGKKEMFAFFVSFSGSSERALNWSITLCARFFFEIFRMKKTTNIYFDPQLDKRHNEPKRIFHNSK